MSATAARKRRDLVALIILAGFLFAVVAHYIRAGYHHLDYPQSTFLFKPQDNTFEGWPEARGLGKHVFGDFFQPWEQTRQPSPYVSPNLYFRSNYPPFAHALLKPLTLLRYRTAVVAYLLVFTGTLFAFVVTSLPGRGPARIYCALTIALLSYPVLLLIDRGNLDGAALLFAVFALAPYRGEWRWWIRPASLGAAGATKLYPIAFALVYVRLRQWKELGVAVAVWVILTFGSACAFAGGPFRALAAFRANLSGFSHRALMDNFTFVHHTNSLSCAIRVLAELRIAGAAAVGAVDRIAAVLAIATVVAVLFLPLQRWQQLFFVCATFTVFSPAAAEYRSSFFLLPLLWLVNDGATTKLAARAYAVALALLLVPKSLPILYSDVTVGVLINPLLVVAIMLGIVGEWLWHRVAEKRSCSPATLEATPGAAEPLRS